MKKILLLLTLLIVSMAGGYAQNSSAPMAWKWDTVICYNDHNEVIERLSQSFDEGGNALSQLIEEKSGNTWINVSRIRYTNDLSGRITSALTERWQADSWLASLSVLVSYDASGHIILESVERYQGGQWGAYIKRSYGYDGEGRKSSMLQQRWIGGIWENDLRTTYSYNANINTVLMEYSDDGSPWEVGGRFTYNCDLNGNYLELLIESWEENLWQNSARVDYINDGDGNILSEWAYAPSGNEWVSDSRKTYTYDSYGNVLSGKNEQWEAGSWLPELQTSYLYSKKEYMLLLNVPVYRYEATYRGFPLGSDNRLAVSFNLYPNPAIDIISIDTEIKNNEVPILYIRDNRGKLINVVRLYQDQSRIDVSGYSPGLYLFIVQTSERSATRKLIIQ